MLALRVATALIGLPVVVYLLLYGPAWSVFSILLFCVVFCVFETAQMLIPRLETLFVHECQSDDRRIPRWKGTSVAAAFSAIAVIIFIVATASDPTYAHGSLVFGMTAALLITVFATPGIGAEMARLMSFLVSLTYGGTPWLVLWDLYKRHGGAGFILVLTIIWAGDTGAYFGGRFFGRTTLAPHKSPKKTREGAFFGLLASVAGAVIFRSFTGNLIPQIWQAVLLGLVGGLFGQLGDLVESVIKRFANVKDSGQLLPGHGGILDRVDGILTGAPAVWFVLYVTGLL